jgi:hypothetical protein
MARPEIACDESGYEGEKLIGTTTDVFAHGSVCLAVEAAARCMRELRERIRSPATEYKANHILREKHRAALEWTLGPSGPLCGRGHVFLIDKEHYVRRKLADALGTDVGAVPDLAAANDLMRARDDGDVVDAFYASAPALAATRPRAEAFRAWLHHQPPGTSYLDPLVPAIARAVARWSADGPVTIVHDRTNTLRPERLAAIRTQIGAPLAALRLTDSFTDPRVQAADLLAGAARRIAEDARHGRPDPVLTELLRRYVDARSVWGDARSWALIAPLAQGR